MKKQFMVWFTQGGKVHSRIEFAVTAIEAEQKAYCHFQLFGSGDEQIFGVDPF